MWLGRQRRILKQHIDKCRKNSDSVDNMSHLNNLQGLLAILQCLMANVSERDQVLRLSYMDFDEAYTLFLSYHKKSSKYSIKDYHLRKHFKEILCHPSYGLTVYIVAGQYILLKSRDVDL